MTITRYDVVRRRAEMVVHDRTVYIGGQVAEASDGDIEAQTREVLESIDQLLERVGSDRSHLLSVRILLARREDYAGMNRVWDAWLPEGCAPSRACTLAELIDPTWRVEMIAVAALS